MNRYPKGITAEQIGSLVGPDPIMLEIGCHDGSDTVKFLDAMPAATIYCFDPEERATSRFQEKLGTDFRVQFLPLALSDTDGYHEFYASTGRAGGREDWDYSGSLCQPTGHYKRSPEIQFKDPVEVLCARLDTIYINHIANKAIDFIWADVQGSQRLLIGGGRQALANTRWLYIESHAPPAYAGEPTQEELIEELDSLFEPIDFYAENILFRNRNLSIL